MTFAKGKVYQFVGCVEKIEISCGSLGAPWIVLVVRKALCESIIGSPNSESLQENLDYGHREVTMLVWKKEVLLSTLSEPSVIDKERKDIEDLMSSGELETESEQFSASSSSEW